MSERNCGAGVTDTDDQPCAECSGTGARLEPYFGPTTDPCDVCKGTGKTPTDVERASTEPPPREEVRRSCPACRGFGRVYTPEGTADCSACDGDGWTLPPSAEPAVAVPISTADAYPWDSPSFDCFDPTPQPPPLRYVGADRPKLDGGDR